MSILRSKSSKPDRERRRARRALARALSTAPTLASQQELRALEARL